MNITIKCRTNPRFPGEIYATCLDESGELMIEASLYYVLYAVKKNGYTITNAQEVLMWLNDSYEFKALK